MSLQGRSSVNYALRLPPRPWGFRGLIFPLAIRFFGAVDTLLARFLGAESPAFFGLAFALGRGSETRDFAVKRKGSPSIG